MSGILTFTLAEKKKKASAPAAAASEKKARKTPAKVAAAPISIALKHAEENIVMLTNPDGWTFRLTPKALHDYSTSWTTILGISQTMNLANLELTVEGKPFMKSASGGYLQVQDMVAAFSLLSL